MDIDNLRKYVNQSPPNWAEDILEDFNAARGLIEKYALSKYWGCDESVNIMDITGTTHPSYARRSWLYLFNNGERMDNVLKNIHKNFDYYNHNTNIKCIRVDNKTFIETGINRICAARFYFGYVSYRGGFTSLHGITLESYRIDHCFKRALERLAGILRRSSSYLSIKKDIIHREDTPGWYRENYELKAVLETDKAKFILTTEDMEEMLIESQKPFKRYTGKYKDIWRVL
jgi:hypothetical protein